MFEIGNPVFGPPLKHWVSQLCLLQFDTHLCRRQGTPRPHTDMQEEKADTFRPFRQGEKADTFRPYTRGILNNRA